jgi:hypothetical protein
MRCPNCGFFSESRRNRSSQANRYFHGVLLPLIANHTGYTLDETKDLLKSMFLRDEWLVMTKGGVREVSVVKASSKLDTAEFESFMSKIRSWASLELGLIVPMPNEGEINENR